MANVKTTNLSTRDSIHLFLQHWKYGHNWEDSTVLIDPSYNIIAYFDNKSSNIDVVMSDMPFDGGYIIENGTPKKIKGKVRYEPVLYDDMIQDGEASMIKLLKEKGDKDGLEVIYGKVRGRVSEYNKNYFSNKIKYEDIL